MAKISLTQIKLAADHGFMENFFRKNIQKYFPGAKLISLNLEIKRSFFRKNFLFTYILNFKKNFKKNQKTIKGKSVIETNNPFDCSKRAYSISKYLWSHNFKNLIPRPLGYLPSLHLFLYEEIPGESLENLISQKKTRNILRYASRIAKLLKKIHHIKFKIGQIKDYDFEKKQDQHHLALIKNFNPKNYKKFKKFLRSVEVIRTQKQKLFLDPKKFCFTHGDFHPGNVLIDGKTIKFIDFGSAGLAEPLTDVANFVLQTELMLRYHLHPFRLSLVKKIRSAFLKGYFGHVTTPQENFKLLYFEIKSLTQIMSVVSLVQHQNPKLQKKSMTAFFKILENRYKQLQKLSKTF
jgi:thiamine kinase-like enzyme